MTMHVNERLLLTAKDAAMTLENAGCRIMAAELRAAIAAAEPKAKRAPVPDDESPYAPARFVPLKPYKPSMREWRAIPCEITFEDGTRIRAHAFDEPGKPVDIGRPARASVEKYKHRLRFSGRMIDGLPVPEIVELRNTETGDIYNIALANKGTADMRLGVLA